MVGRAQCRRDLLVEPTRGDPGEDLALAPRQFADARTELRRQRLFLPLPSRRVGRSAERGKQHGLVARLLEKVERTGADRAHGRGDVAVTGEEHRRNLDASFGQHRLQRQPVGAGHTKIDEKHLRLPSLER
jgi:hypothetical protein